MELCWLGATAVPVALSFALRSLIAYDKCMQPYSIKLYTTQSCPYCDELKEYLYSLGQLFEEARVDDVPEMAREIVSLVGDEVVPVTVVQRAGSSPVAIVGFDRQRLDAVLGDAT